MGRKYIFLSHLLVQDSEEDIAQLRNCTTGRREEPSGDSGSDPDSDSDAEKPVH
jgi:hypothetical protein